MKRFQRGEFAVTCNTRAPLINDGHLVRIVEVAGPMPGDGLAFAYVIERVDGEPFMLGIRPGSPAPTWGGLQLLADQRNLRPLRGAGAARGVNRSAEVEG